MSNKDLLHRFLFDQAPVRGEFVQLSDSFQTILSQHAYPPALRQLLGEALCVVGLLSAIIKFEGRVTIQFQGSDKLKLLLAQCDNHFHLRGLAKWEGECSYEELMTSLQQGVLVIMLDSGSKQKRYQGIVAWRGNSLAESIEGYFQDSEQLATRIWLSVGATSAAGFLLQIIPGSDSNGLRIEPESVASHWERITALTDLVTPDDLLSLDDQALLAKLYPSEDVRVFDAVPVAFECTCSRKRGKDAIYIMGEEDALDELKSMPTIVVTCEFCNNEYVFDRADVNKIFENKDVPPTNTQIH